ncbi:MAG: FtsX-like permease family protein [Bacteroidota bacterium]
MNLLQLSWKNLTFKPLSMLLSVVLFALGVGLISLLFLLNNQLEKNFEKNLAGVDLVIGAKGSPLQLILSSMYHIDAPTGNITLKEARPFLNPKHPLIQQAIPLSMGDNYRGYRILGTTHEILDFYDATVAEGKIWSQNYEVTIGASLASELGMKIGDEFKSSHGFVDDEDLAHDDAPSFRVVGILNPTGSVIDQLILTTTQTYWAVHEEHDHEGEEHSEEEYEHSESEHDHEDHDHDGDGKADHAAEYHVDIPKSLLEEDDEKSITSLLIKFKGRNFQALNMQRSINENTDMQAATPAIEVNRLYSLMNTGEQALTILAYVIIFVSGLSIFISLFSSLKERKYELALMRVMGAKPGKLFSLIVLEGLLLAIIGFAIGILLSHGGMQIFAGAMKDAYRYTFSGWEFLPQELYLLIGTLVIGFLAAVIPAIQAANTDISETLTR